MITITFSNTFQIMNQMSAILGSFITRKAWATCAGTRTASFEGISFGLRKIWNWAKTEPVRTLAKNTVHMVNRSILLQALLSIPLKELNPCIVENSFIIEGTYEETSRRMTLGRYPVTSWLTTALQGPYKIRISEWALPVMHYVTWSISNGENRITKKIKL